MNSPLLLLASLALCIGLLEAISVPVSYDDPTCGGPQPTKTLLCYYEGSISLERVDPCLCTHVVFSGNITTVRSDNFTVSLTTDVGNSVRTLRRRNPELVTVLRVTIPGETPLVKAERRSTFVSSLGRIVRNADLNGIEILLEAPQQISNSAQAREGLSKLLKLLRKELGVQKTHRSRRDYSVFETIEDDVSTEAYSPFRKSVIRGTRTTAEASVTSPRHKTILRSARTDDDGKAREALRETLLQLEKLTPKERVILLSLPAQPELLVKRYDLKVLGKYADLFVLPTHNLTDITENGLTYHPSRLMGLSDLLNTDSLVDLVTGLGAARDKLVISIPSQAIQFTLKNVTRNTPRSPVTTGPKYLTQSQLCGLMEEGGWTIERDEDLTAPYAFRNETWLAFDDSISIGIKSKYVLLRDLAGAAMYPMDAIDWQGSCHQEDNKTSSARLLRELHSAFTTLARKSRGAVLQTLQEDIHTSSLLTFSGEVHLSPYRIVRVIDNQGAVHVVRKDARTQFECSRQGYFRHPLGCNRFYRCVKFNQYSSDYTVFEYDCPAGLAFDERWEVCVWPGSLPEGACHGSSEIAPVPRARYACPAIEGYYADPENCRWFFACLDHARDGASPLTAYEFRCPFGLVFDERNLVCNWPWLVDGCGNAGVYLGVYSGSIALGSAAGRGFAATAENRGAGQAGKSTIVYESGPVAVQDIFGSSGVVGQVAASYISGGSASGGEGRHIESYASFPDYLVSGGRIDKSGGVILEGNLALSGVDRDQLRYSTGRGSFQEGGASYQAGNTGSGRYVAAAGAGGAGTGAHSSFRVDGVAGAYGSRGGAGAALGGQRGAAGSLAAGGVAYEVHGVETGGSVGAGSGAYLVTGTGNAGEGAQSSSFRIDGNSGSYGARAGTGSRGGVAGTLATGGVAYEAHGIRAGAALNAESATYVTTGASDAGAGAHSNTFRVDGSAGAYGTRAGIRNRGGAAGTIATGTVAYGTQGIGSGATLVAGGDIGTGVPYGVHGIESGAALRGGEALGSRGGGGVAYGSHVETFGVQSGSFSGAGEAQRSRTGAGVAYGTRVEAFGTRGNAALAADQTLGGRSGAIGTLGSEITYGSEDGATLVNGEAVGSQSGTIGALGSGFSHGNRVETTEIHGNNGATVFDQGAGLTYGTRVHASGGGVGALRSGSGVALGQGATVTYGAQVQTVGVQSGDYNSAGGAVVTPIAALRSGSGVAQGQGATVTYGAQVQAVGVQDGAYNAAEVNFGTRIGTSVRGQGTSQAFGGKAGTYQPQGEVYQPAVYEANKITSEVPAAAVQPAVATYQQTVVPKVEVATVEKTVVPKLRLQPAVPITTYQQNVISKVEVQPVVTTYQQTAVPRVQVQPAVATYQQAIVPKARARPTVTTYQQNIAGRVPIQPAVTTYQETILPKVQSSTIRPVPIASYQEVIQPNVQVTSVNNAVPVATYQETLIPKVTVSSTPTAIPVVNYQQTAVPRVRVRPTQPSIAVSTYQQAQQPEIQVSAVHPTVSTVLQTSRPRVSFTRVQPTTPARTYQQSLIPQVSISTAAPIVSVEQNVQPGVSFQTTYTGTRGYSSSRARPSVSVKTSGSAGYISSGNAAFTTSAPAVTLPSASYSYSSTPAPVPAGFSYSTPAVQFLTGVVSSTPAPIVQGYSRTSSKTNFLTSPAVQVSYQKTPVVISTTAAPISQGYSADYSISSGDSASTFISGIPSSTPSPIATRYSYRRPSVPDVPVAPVAVSTQRPDAGYVYTNPSFSVTSGEISSSRFRTPTSTPSVGVDYSYSKPSVSGGSRAFGRGRVYSTTTASVPTFIESSTPAAVAVDYAAPFVSGAVSNSRPAFVSNEYSYQKSSISAGRSRKPKPTESPEEVAARLGIGLEPATPSPALFNLPTFDNVEVANYGARFQPTIKYSTPAPTFVSVTPTVLSVPNCTASSPNLRVSNIGYRGQYDFGSRSTGSVSTTSIPTVTYSTTTAPSTTARVSLPSSTSQYRGNNAGARRGGVKTKISYEDGNVEALLDKYSGNFGGLFNNGKQEFIDEVVSTGGRGRQYSSTTTAYSTTTAAPYSTTTTTTPYRTSTSAPRGKARFEGTGGDQRVVVVTRLSDINPLLVAKLGAQCTCKPESPVLRLKPDDSEATAYAADLASPRGYPSGTPEHVPSAPLPGSSLVTGSELSPDDNLGIRISSSAVPLSSSTTPRTVLITTSRPRPRSRNQYFTSSTTTSPSFGFTDDYSGTSSRSRPVTSTYAPAQASASQSRGRPLNIISSTAAPTLSVNSDEVEINARGQSEAGVGGGRAFDRYGPGGLRGIDETLQGSVDCQRPGLFRHPKYCNKFYACHWDQWKGRYTLHVFNCPVHLAYDNSLGACNWPSKGPACTDDNLLV